MKSDNYGLEILTNEFYSLKQKLVKAEKEMIDLPNENSKIAIDFFKQKMRDINELLKLVAHELR